MRKRLILLLLILSAWPVWSDELLTLTVKTSAPSNRKLEWRVRQPAKYTPGSRIMVLFGGRNWDGAKAIDAYGFGKLADRYGIFLVSPSFKDDDYWEPGKWSGTAMLEALTLLRQRFGLKGDTKLFYYGYSAGGQCANLFYHWKPEIVEAWGAHACGVWFKPETVTAPCQALITCGENDEGRFLLSSKFVRDAREKGYSVLWRGYPGEHELNAGSLRLAELFFDDIAAGSRTAVYVGDDQTMNYYPATSRNGTGIEQEYRNNFFSLKLAECWKTGKQD